MSRNSCCYSVVLRNHRQAVLPTAVLIPPGYSDSGSSTAADWHSSIATDHDDEGWKRKVHALLPNYNRNTRLAPTFTRARFGGCGEPRRNAESVNRRNARLAPSLTCAGTEGCCSDGGAKEKRRTYWHEGPPWGDDRFASDRGVFTTPDRQ